MPDKQELRLRLMTYNIGGGRRDFGSDFEKVVSVIQNEEPDILAIQESTEHQLPDGRWVRLAENLAKASGFLAHYFFGSTVSMREQFHIGKTNFIQALFDDWLDLKFGNAIFSRKKFIGLGDSSIFAKPRSIPVFHPPGYQGNRDTEPRKVVLAKVDCGSIQPTIIATHLTTLVGERGGGEREISGKRDAAKKLRIEQCQNILNLIQKHVLDREEIVFLMGDFNATANEPCFSDILESYGGFVHLTPEGKNIPTHLKHGIQIDHIFMFPSDRLIGYKCRVVNERIAQQASDHLPVVADVVVK